MPDITNADLMEFICRIMKKVDMIETKLNRVLGIEEEEQNYVVSPVQSPIDHNEVDVTFRFSPIHDDDELIQVTQKITGDERYLRNLRLTMQNKRKFGIEDIFSETFLVDYNLTGMYGKKKLEGLVPYEQVYVYLRKLKGEESENIRRFVMNEMHRIKKRISTRKRARQDHKRLKRTYDGSILEEGQIPTEYHGAALFTYRIKDELIDDEDSMNSLQEESESGFDVEMIPDDNPLDEGSDVQIKEEEPLSIEDYNENRNVFAGMPPSSSEGPRTILFRQRIPIATDSDLAAVQEQMDNDPEYTEKLRKYFSEKSPDQICTLEQLFTIDFLHNYNYSGACDKGKLIDLDLYREVYYYLRRKKGQTNQEIGIFAKQEMRRMKKRVWARVKRNPDAPPRDRKFKKIKITKVIS